MTEIPPLDPRGLTPHARVNRDRWPLEQIWRLPKAN